MNTLLEFEAYGEAIGNGAAVIRDHAKRAGFDTTVVTCPDWKVADLVAHVGMVHRWVTGLLRSEPIDTDAAFAEGHEVSDALQWLDDGLVGVLQALVDARESDNPAALATARKMAHATTIHAVDAMSASLGRTPRADEVWFGAAHALDGIDALLFGGLSEEASRVRSEQPRTLALVADDVAQAWTVIVSPEPATVIPRSAGNANTTWSGNAVDLYLHLWNRGGEIRESGIPYRDQWRELSAVSWGD